MVIPSGNSARSLTTLGKVTETVYERSKNCWDDFISRDDISFQDIDSVLIAGEIHALKPVAQRNIANRLGVNVNYLRRCPKELQAENLNYWITQEKNEELFFRFDGQVVRAIFTPRYTCVDNALVISKLLEMGFSSTTNVQCSLDDNLMVLSIPDGDKTFSINGDQLIPGVSIINSETSCSSLQIRQFTYRIICQNGLIAKTEIQSSFRHVSRRILKEMPVIFENISHGLLKQRDQYRISVASIVEDRGSTLKSFSRQFKLSNKEIEAVQWAAPQEPGNSMFNIIQIFGRAAQFPGLKVESSFMLEKVAGDLLSLVN